MYEPEFILNDVIQIKYISYVIFTIFILHVNLKVVVLRSTAYYRYGKPTIFKLLKL